MRSIIVGIYLFCLIVFTCTESLSLLFTDYEISFRFNPHPDGSSFFHNDLLNVSDPTYLSQKLGHVLFFSLLAFLGYWAWKSLGLVVMVSLAAALSTEVAQLYFSRSGRLLDVGFDLAGMLLFIVLVFFYRFIKRSPQDVEMQW
ncbi:VanZ family protein [Metabacillus halosaccharovorans]|uniref:VanZ family protein n=1 Tax=Metabacillus halosaccharovorans TaxID=930124 RepID=UPI001C1FB222|nr:VanZ family protein [Metabacillus halosaccharovorans]